MWAFLGIILIFSFFWALNFKFLNLIFLCSPRTLSNHLLVSLYRFLALMPPRFWTKDPFRISIISPLLNTSHFTISSLISVLYESALHEYHLIFQFQYYLLFSIYFIFVSLSPKQINYYNALPYKQTIWVSLHKSPGFTSIHKFII